jgi:soluble lytic murein transglycosylase-like protein
VAAYLKERLKGFQTDESGNTIKRYRDHQGVWCIMNEPAPEPQVSPPQSASGAQLAVSAVAHAPPDRKMFSTMTWPPGFARPPLAPQELTVLSRRDTRGVVHIFNRAFGQDMGKQDSPASFLGRVSPLLQACIIEAAQLYQLPVSLIVALIRQESDFVHQAVSPKGAMGLMQLMPGTAASLGVRDPFDPRENVLAGCRYFRLLLDYFQGSIPLALAGYNAGYHRVVSAGCQVPNIKETQEFVTQVMGLYCFLEQRATGL